MSRAQDLEAIAAAVLAGRGLAHKTDIAGAMATLGLGEQAIRVGDDCAAIPDGEGWLLLAIEGFVNDFVEADPRFAGHCGIMVNLSDVAAMGGRAVAVVDAVWARDAVASDPLLAGLREAAAIYDVPIVGGHTNHRAERGQLAVAVLGRAKRLITSFDARDGDVLVAAIDLRGGFRGATPYWDAATGAPAARLRGDLEVLPRLAEDGLVAAGKDVSMAGLVGTAAMLLDASGGGGWIDVDAVPRPPDVDLARFLLAFPSYGFLLAVRPDAIAAVVERFASRSIACAAVGGVDATRRLRLRRGADEAQVWDFARPFIGAGRIIEAGRTEAGRTMEAV